MRVFAATSRYLQGPALIDHLGKHVLEVGRRAVIITDVDVERLFGERISASFSSQNAEAKILVAPGEVTLPSIAQLAERARAFSADIIVGVGGGKSIDAAKGGVAPAG
jgi:glycerol dehydrogenase